LGKAGEWGKVGRHVRYPANSISHCPESSTDFHAEGPQPGTKPKGTTGKERQGRQGTTRTPHLGDREVRGRQGDCPEANFDYTYGVLILLLQSDSECVRPFLALSGQFFFSFLLFLGIQNERTAQSSLSPYQHSSTPNHHHQTNNRRAGPGLSHFPVFPIFPVFPPPLQPDHNSSHCPW
jgi:hypothetical protein